MQASGLGLQAFCRHWLIDLTVTLGGGAVSVPSVQTVQPSHRITPGGVALGVGPRRVAPEPRSVMFRRLY